MLDGQMGKLLQQAQKLQADINKVREGLKNKQVEAVVDGGTIKVVANGRQEIVNIVIDNAIIHPANANVIKDLLIKGVNQALEKSKKMANEEMSKVTGGLNLSNMPGLF